MDYIISELKKKDEIIKNLQNEINKINKKNEEDKSFYLKEINQLKEDNKKEIDSMKEAFESEIKALKEEISKNNQIEKKENNNQIKRREFNAIKEDLNDFNEKLSKFERVFDNKLDFIESALSRLLEKEEQQKEEQKEEKKEDQKEKNNNNNNQNNNNKINEKKQIEFVEDYLEKDPGVWKDFLKQIDVIFSEKYSNTKDIKEGELKKLKKLSLNLTKKNKSTIEKFNDYFSNKIKPKINKNNNSNYLYKKSKIFELLNEVESEINKDKNEKEKKKINPKNFKIKEFRKEYNLDEKEFPDNLLKQKYIECNGNEQDLFIKLIQK